MNKSQSKKVTIQEMESYFSKITFTDDVIRINSCTEVLNLEKFVKSHLSALKANSGKRTFLPYYERLVQVYNLYNS